MARTRFEGETPPEQVEVCPVTETQNIIAGKWKIKRTRKRPNGSQRSI